MEDGRLERGDGRCKLLDFSVGERCGIDAEIVDEGVRLRIVSKDALQAADEEFFKLRLFQDEMELAAAFGNLQRRIAVTAESGHGWLSVDVGDGAVFVPVHDEMIPAVGNECLRGDAI